MAYWSGSPTGNDYAVTHLAASVVGFKKRMFESASLAIEKRHPEQALVAHLRAIRAVIERFPKELVNKPGCDLDPDEMNLV